MNFTRVKLVTFVPLEQAERVQQALGEAGAGTIGEYQYCSYTVRGTGRFMPTGGAKPHIGEVDKLQEVEEERIEVVCDKTMVKQIITALKTAHPYEEVAFDITPVLDESDF